MEEKKPVVAVKYNFGCRDKSKVITILEFSDYQDSDVTENLCSNLSANTTMEYTKSLVMENEKFQYRDETINSIIWNIGRSVFLNYILSLDFLSFKRQLSFKLFHMLQTRILFCMRDQSN